MVFQIRTQKEMQRSCGDNVNRVDLTKRKFFQTKNETTDMNPPKNGAGKFVSHLCSYVHCRSIIHYSQKRKITDVPLTGEWSKEIHSNYMEYYPALKGNEVLTFIKIMIELGTKLLKGKCHTQKDKCHMKPSIVNLTEIKSRISRGCRE